MILLMALTEDGNGSGSSGSPTREQFADNSLRTIALSDGATATIGAPAAADEWQVEIFATGEHGGRVWTLEPARTWPGRPDT